MSHRLPLPPFLEEYIKEGELTEQGLWWLNLVRTYSVDIRRETFTFNPDSVAANITVEQTVTITGLNTVDDVLTIIKPTLTAGLGVLGGRVSSANTLSITFINTTANPIDAGSETYTLIYLKNSKV